MQAAPGVEVYRRTLAPRQVERVYSASRKASRPCASRWTSHGRDQRTSRCVRSPSGPSQTADACPSRRPRRRLTGRRSTPRITSDRWSTSRGKRPTSVRARLVPVGEPRPSGVRDAVRSSGAGRPRDRHAHAHEIRRPIPAGRPDRSRDQRVGGDVEGRVESYDAKVVSRQLAGRGARASADVEHTLAAGVSQWRVSVSASLAGTDIADAWLLDCTNASRGCVVVDRKSITKAGAVLVADEPAAGVWRVVTEREGRRPARSTTRSATHR